MMESQTDVLGQRFTMTNRNILSCRYLGESTLVKTAFEAHPVENGQLSGDTNHWRLVQTGGGQGRGRICQARAQRDRTPPRPASHPGVAVGHSCRSTFLARRDYLDSLINI